MPVPRKTVIATSLLAALLVGAGSAAAEPAFERLAGADRWATAAAVSRDAFPQSSDVVVVATGSAFADALAGGPVAARYGSPLLLTARDVLPDATRQELARLAPRQILLLGGTGAVSDAVERQLSAVAPVQRLQGPNRFATAAAASAASFAADVPVAYVASGTSPADALAGGAAAAAHGGPVLLTARDVLPAETERELRRLAPRRIVVLGGASVISAGVEQALRGLSSEVRRDAGVDRYATAAVLSRSAFPGVEPLVYLATGLEPADALGGAAAAGSLGAPLLLTGRWCLPAPIAAELVRLDPARVVVLGGARAVAQAAASGLACRVPPPARASCEDDPLSRVTCRFVRALQSREWSALDDVEQEVAGDATAVPFAAFEVVLCELVGDVTVQCDVVFEGGATRAYLVAPANGEYDPETGGIDLPPGEELRYHVVGEA